MYDDGNKFDWEEIKKQTNHILGDDFWEDLDWVPKKGPSVDLFETEKNVIVIMELPGLQTLDQVKVSLSGHKLIVEGEIQREYSSHVLLSYKMERFVGTFKREILLPLQYVYKEIHASYKHGLLTIAFNKAPVQTFQQISISLEEGFNSGL